MSLDVEALYRELAPQMVAYFARRLPQRDRHLAEDLAADVFVNLLTALPRYASRRDHAQYGLTWTIARRVLIDCYRRCAARPVGIIFGPSDYNRVDHRTEEAIEDIADRLLVESLVFPVEQRDALDAKYWLGESWGEAAQRLGTTEEAMKKRHFRAIRTARRQIA